MLTRKYASSGCPLTASTTFPSQSTLMPYSKRVPGSESMGAVNALLLPGRMFGVPVTCS